MRNRPTSIFDSSSPRSGTAFDVDAEPGLRLVWLFAAMTLPLLVVAGRLLYLQGFVAEGFAVEARHETETIESIPARNGRILASDGTVLAFDEERFQLLMHYRWLEEPLDQAWLRHEAMSRLSRAERRDAKRVEQAIGAVLQRRESLWHSLAELTECSPDILKNLRARIQQRVENIYQQVEERRGTVNGEPQSPTAELHGQSVPKSIGEAWQVVKHELTTNPTRERLEPLRISEQSEYHLLLDDVPLEVVAEIETQPEQYPGVRTGITSRRVYPRGRIAPHLVGYRGEIDSDELKSRRMRFPNGDPLDYQPRDSIGRSGVEQSYEQALRGTRGRRKITRDRHGTIVRTEILEPPKAGRDVVLNFSVELQERATALLEEALEGDAKQDEQVGSRPRGGCIVAIDVQTGAVLTAAVAPTFDVNDFLSGSDEVRQALLSDPRRPMFPRATQMALPPGSVFKTVTAVAGIQSGRIDPDRQIECLGYLKDPNKLRCYHSQAHYGTNLTMAIARSCNVYFFQAAQTLGPHALVQWADAFGFGERTGIDLLGERPGHVPRPPDRSPRESRTDSIEIELAGHESERTQFDLVSPGSPWDKSDSLSRPIPSRRPKREPWYEGDTLGLAIGQSRLTVTPMQVARLMAAVANGGLLLTPHVVREIGPAASSAQSVRTSEPIETEGRRIPNLSAGTLARVREGLQQVVAHPLGTGYKTVRITEVSIAGKTGTAEIGGGRPDHAWFAGYVPANQPQIAFVVVLEQAGSGGKVAGPVANRFVRSLLELGLVRDEDALKR